jgi:hypothetical protein
MELIYQPHTRKVVAHTGEIIVGLKNENGSVSEHIVKLDDLVALDDIIMDNVPDSGSILVEDWDTSSGRLM